MDLKNILLIVLYVTLLRVGFASINTTRLPSEEVDALREIGKKLGKDWDFDKDPCVDWPNITKEIEAYDDSVGCNCSATIWHVISISLKGQKLSGTLPPELADLQYLQNIALTCNNLSGSIPPEWGSMKNLLRLFLNFNNFRGEIPASFANLNKLQDFRISGNSLFGKIPEFIGKWKNLNSLWIEASGLMGPIPYGIALLPTLKDLRISDLKGQDTLFPPFINTTSFENLILRSCNLFGNLPESLSASLNLKVLDLSFNKLNGSIPKSYIYINKTEYIYLTGNMLSGSVPDWMLTDGRKIDLSYNKFIFKSSWKSCKIRDTNLFASFATDNVSKDFVSCLGNTNCRSDRTSLYINCGGEGVLFEGKSYEDDDTDLDGPSSFYNKTDDQWGFSSTGHFINDSRYIIKDGSASGAPGKSSELYENARTSAISLTYYGWCMRNGSYNVSLHFAEIVLPHDGRFGRRIFDIYIQGMLKEKDFDISNEAGGSGKVIVKNYTVNVTTTLEIRLSRRGAYGPLISAISVNPNFWVRTNDGFLQGNGNSVSVGTVAGIVVGAVCVIILVLGVLWCQGCLRHKDTNDIELNGITCSFTLRQIKTATNNFNDANKIGEGGFGSVYKGVLPDGTLIAVKQLSAKSRQGNREFLNELGMISALQHPHLVKLHGCCIEGNQLLLAYEYMENNSLARALFGPKEWQLVLDWPTRYTICIDIARGLAFLHEESRLKIVHRDIKATNVLLDKDLKAKISDFGLAKLDEEDDTHISTRVAGTYGYMAPEYALRGYLTDKADVYSYGIVLLEIVSGMANVADKAKENHFVLLDRAVALNNTGNIMELVDSRLDSEYDMQELMVVINLALLCTTISPTNRPSMSAVVSMLEGRIVPRSFASEQSTSMSIMDRDKMKKILESTTESQIDDISIPYTNSSMSAGDLYPVDRFSEYLQKRDGDGKKLLS